MKNNSMPAVWLIVLIAGIGMISETVYSPAIPSIADFLKVKQSWIEYTLTIYLFSFGIGTFFWGRISDHFGRKPCIIAGIITYIIGSFLCYLSDSFWLLMVSRFIQGFGGSIGSVLGQAICRDAYQGKDLSKAYSVIGGSLAIFPALGPIVGGLITQELGWQMIFILLTFFGIIVLIISMTNLCETLPAQNRHLPNLLSTLRCLALDKNVIGCGLLVGLCNGINFSYYAEGPFSLIDILGLSPSMYGATFGLLALATTAGGLISRKLHNHLNSLEIIKIGIWLTIASCAIFSVVVLVAKFVNISSENLIFITIFCMMLTMAGNCMVSTNSLAKSLQHYKQAIGTASALFGFFYYIVVALITLAMGILHNGTLIPMPIFFLAIGIGMKIIFKRLIKNQ
ncbi:MAG: multidrug effflux MFS transporter [Proteobacteria bacterium]|nr:multidrug effflux MFS transporter [Pseudomonadota bacterium]